MDTLLKFTIENFRSISERKTFSLVPTTIKDEPVDNVVLRDQYRYLRTAAIYGANSSGKSNLVRGIECMLHLVRSSVRMNDEDALDYQPFLLNGINQSVPTLYEIEFVTDGKRYRYGFSNTDKRIYDEWLVRIEKQKEVSLFIRNEEGIGVNEELFPEGKNLEERTNDNRLFLSLVGQLGGETSNSVIQFFRKGISVISGLDTEQYGSFTKHYLSNKLPGSEDMKQFFRNLQLGFTSVSTMVHEFDLSDLPSSMPEKVKEDIAKRLLGKKRIKVMSSHDIYDDSGNVVKTEVFDFDEMESAGTRKLFDFAGPMFDTLASGSVLVVDELDAKMHPLLSLELVRLFNDPKRNKKGAQLIFTTHDTNLLSSKILRRDQIWFTEKDDNERTDLYNMMQIFLPDGSKPGGDGNIERNYINGRYGAIPYIRPYSE